MTNAVRFFQILAVATLMLPSQRAVAASCDLNGKTINAVMTMWGPERPPMGGQPGDWAGFPLKIKVIGDKVLFYGNPAADENAADGMVYRLGRTIDMTRDPLQTQRYQSSFPDSTVERTLTSSYDGIDLRLVDEERITYLPKRQMIFHLKQSIRIAVVSCTTCLILEYDRHSDSAVPDKDVDDHLVDEQCAIQ
ncbi:MAG TPA: hypothetical protein VII56_10740 [Rhizomicrobium sp.]